MTLRAVVDDAREATSQPLGYVVGESTTENVAFTAAEDAVPARLDYVVLGGGDGPTTVAQVTEVTAYSALFAPTSSHPAAHQFAQRQMTDGRFLCQARVLGHVEPATGARRRTRTVAHPGMPVRRATDADLVTFFGVRTDQAIPIGHLFTREDVPVHLDVRGIGMHLAVLGQTRIGKTTVVAKVTEQMHALGATLIVFDPNSDYVRMRFKADGATRRELAGRVRVFRPPGVQGRYNTAATGAVTPFVLAFARLPFEHVCSLLDLHAGMTRLRTALAVAVGRAKTANRSYQPAELVAALETMRDQLRVSPPARRGRAAQDHREEQDDEPMRPADLDGIKEDEVVGVLQRVHDKLTRHQALWGPDGVDFDRLIDPMTLSVLDLGGAARATVQAVAGTLLRTLWGRAQEGLAFPVFLVVEEAHNLAPRRDNQAQAADDEFGAAYWINRIGTEGAKYGLYLILVSQRPGKVAEDALACCNSQIVMRLTNPRDQTAVINASEQLSQALMQDLPGLDVGEGVAVGPIVPVPVLFKAGARESAPGGASRDLVGDLARAREVATGAMRARPVTAPAPPDGPAFSTHPRPIRPPSSRGEPQ